MARFHREIARAIALFRRTAAVRVAIVIREEDGNITIGSTANAEATRALLLEAADAAAEASALACEPLRRPT